MSRRLKMETLPDAALKFCRECLCWETANNEHSSDSVIWNGKFREHSDGFHFTDLNAVMEAVRGWCKDHGVWHQITCAPGGIYVVYILRMKAHGDVPPISIDCSARLCHALLVACVEASRSMKERQA